MIEERTYINNVVLPYAIVWEILKLFRKENINISMLNFYGKHSMRARNILADNYSISSVLSSCKFYNSLYIKDRDFHLFLTLNNILNKSGIAWEITKKIRPFANQALQEMLSKNKELNNYFNYYVLKTHNMTKEHFFNSSKCLSAFMIMTTTPSHLWKDMENHQTTFIKRIDELYLMHHGKYSK